PSDLGPIDRSALLLLENDSTEANVGITSNYTKRSSLEFDADARRTTFSNMPQNDFSSFGGRVRWKRQMRKDLAVHAGYGRDLMRQQYPEGPREFTNELVDVGVDYSRSFSLARRTTLAFSTETSMLSENHGAQH